MVVVKLMKKQFTLIIKFLFLILILIFLLNSCAPIFNFIKKNKTVDSTPVTIKDIYSINNKKYNELLVIKLYPPLRKKIYEEFPDKIVSLPFKTKKIKKTRYLRKKYYKKVRICYKIKNYKKNKFRYSIKNKRFRISYRVKKL